MPTVHLFWQQHSNLMKISSKVKSSVKTILSLTSQSRISKASQERKRINNTKEKSNNKKNNNDSSTIINVRGNHNNIRSCPISSESSSSIKGEYRSKLMHYMGMKLLSDDEILVSRGFGISQVQVSVCRDGDENEDGAAQSDRSSQSTRVEHGLGQGYRQNFEDLEAQRSSSPGRRVAAERRQF